MRRQKTMHVTNKGRFLHQELYRDYGDEDDDWLSAFEGKIEGPESVEEAPPAPVEQREMKHSPALPVTALALGVVIGGALGYWQGQSLNRYEMKTQTSEMTVGRFSIPSTSILILDKHTGNVEVRNSRGEPLPPRTPTP